MPLVRIPEPFDHPDWLYEIKHDGFRALAVIEGHHCRLVSRRGHVLARWDQLTTEIAHSVRAHDAILDGELVCLDADGRSNFHRLLFRRDWPFYYAFDVLSVGRENVQDRPLLERKRILRRVMPRIDSRLLFVDHVKARGCDLFRAACDRDLEGIVAKWSRGPYQRDGVSTSWIKVKNPQYSQAEGRYEFFDQRSDQRHAHRRSGRAPVLSLRATV
jgi:bifunctional non-homologous end joining protein LigD